MKENLNRYNSYSASISTGLLQHSFGMLINERSFSSAAYKYGYNGKEKDDETYEGCVAFEYRIYDSRLGRFFTTDPMKESYPWQSSYLFAHNSPIALIDFLGLGDPQNVALVESDKNTDKIVYKITYKEFKEVNTPLPTESEIAINILKNSGKANVPGIQIKEFTKTTYTKVEVIKEVTIKYDAQGKNPQISTIEKVVRTEITEYKAVLVDTKSSCDFEYNSEDKKEGAPVATSTAYTGSPSEIEGLKEQLVNNRALNNSPLNNVSGLEQQIKDQESLKDGLIVGGAIGEVMLTKIPPAAVIWAGGTSGAILSCRRGLALMKEANAKNSFQAVKLYYFYEGKYKQYVFGSMDSQVEFFKAVKNK